MITHRPVTGSLRSSDIECVPINLDPRVAAFHVHVDDIEPAGASRQTSPQQVVSSHAQHAAPLQAGHGRGAFAEGPSCARFHFHHHNRLAIAGNDVDFAEAGAVAAGKNDVPAAAGASLDHSHSQLIALPIVPREVRDEVDGARQHFANKERCVFCDIIRQDSADGRRIISENADMVALAPYAPRFPFETWILPKRHLSLYEDAPRHEYASLARLLGDLLRRMNKALVSPPYNLLIHSAPFVEPANEFYHWHVEIMPKLTKVAGFEWATGFYLNPTAPEEAAQVLRDARV
jgi:diadenosine tetraphosphate (Ap4A) HIT family hydrolase